MIGAGVWCTEHYARELCNSRNVFRSRCGSVDRDLPKWCRQFVNFCHDSFGTELL